MKIDLSDNSLCRDIAAICDYVNSIGINMTSFTLGDYDKYTICCRINNDKEILMYRDTKEIIIHNK